MKRKEVDREVRMNYSTLQKNGRERGGIKEQRQSRAGS